MKKRMLGNLLIVTMFITSMFLPVSNVEAASDSIMVNDFIESLVISLKLDTSSDISEPYIDAATKAGILISTDFNNNYSGYITRTDAAVLLNRADEYLHGNTLEEKLLNWVLTKRISDISKAPQEKREAVAKCVAKGIIKGYSNGYYIQNRAFRGNEYLTESAAKAYIKLVVNPSGRAKLSPDGMLIRTTKLPKYAKYYPYILESFPNRYYDWKFQYEDKVKHLPETNKEVKYEYLTEYAPPIDVVRTTYFDNFEEVKDKYLSTWVEKVRSYVESTFNVDYRTIDETWINKMLLSDYSYGNDAIAEQAKENLVRYIKNMKKNKTIVESSKVGVDGSSLFFFDGYYYLRVYVKYRIKSSNIKYGVDVDTLLAENSYGNILYSRLPFVYINKYSIGKWKESCFDVQLAWYSQKSPDSLGVSYAILDEAYYEKRRVDK